MPRVSATFETRREAEMSVERFVQTHGVDRKAIAVEPAGAANTAGTEIAGADAKRESPSPPPNDDAALNGRVRVSVERDATDVETARAVFEEFKAAEIETL